MEETEYYEPEPVLAQYKDAVEKNVKWEKGHFCLAKYYEKLMNAWDGNKEGRKKGKQYVQQSLLPGFAYTPDKEGALCAQNS